MSHDSLLLFDKEISLKEEVSEEPPHYLLNWSVFFYACLLDLLDLSQQQRRKHQHWFLLLPTLILVLTYLPVGRIRCKLGDQKSEYIRR